jgi:hypothetical protein
MLEDPARAVLVVDDEADAAARPFAEGGKGFDVDALRGESFGEVGEGARSVGEVDRELRHARTIRRPVAMWVAVIVLAAACGESGEPAADSDDGGIAMTVVTTEAPAPATTDARVADPARCADVIAVEVTPETGGTYHFAVTVASEETGWEAYADRWEVLVDGEVVAGRVLLHPHVDEQPFTRGRSGVAVPSGPVVVRAHHSTGGHCGEVFEIEVG